MANTIQIKHGEISPGDGILQPFELGYVTSTGTLVIGNSNKETTALNYLQVDSDGYISTLKSKTNLTFSSTASNPKLILTSTNAKGKVNYCLESSTGRAYILEHPILASGSYYERYNLPQPSTSLTANKTYTILTTKGGSYEGNFTFNNTVEVSGTLTANGGIVVDRDSYGDYDPNGIPGDSSKPAKEGVAGQLYFVLVEE